MEREKKAAEIIEMIRNLPSTGYGAYKYHESLVKIIDKVMGYEEWHFAHGKIVSNETEKVSEIVRRMVAKKIIVFNKSGSMFKLN